MVCEELWVHGLFKFTFSSDWEMLYIRFFPDYAKICEVSLVLLISDEHVFEFWLYKCTCCPIEGLIFYNKKWLNLDSICNRSR
jgi:hypothetical protein